MKHLLAPSILAADFADLKSAVQMVNESNADWLHLDVMDGHFVPNISFGFPVIKAIKKYCKKPMDVHLMISEPDRYLEAFAQSGADVITVHYEACKHLHRSLQHIKQLGKKMERRILAGVAVNPHTPVAQLQSILPDVDLVCLMSVNPGFGGQAFIPNSLHKIKQLRQLMYQLGSNAHIEVDGGVKLENGESILRAGADVLVAGSSVFGANNPEAAIAAFKNMEPNVKMA